MSSNNSNGGITANQLKLTDVIVDCLEHVFSYLDYRDLFAVAHTNKQLKIAAGMAFARKFGKKKFVLFSLHVENSRRSHLPGIIISGDYFIVYNLKTSLQLLRCFGYLITNLQILFNAPPNQNRERNFHHVLRYTTDYCSTSLIELSLHHIPDGIFDSVITKPFSKLEALKLFQCDLGMKKKEFNVLFPSMRRLDLISNQFFNWASLEKHFIRLEHLGIVGSDKTHTKSIRAALRLNPQLRSFSLDRVYSPEFLRYASKFLTHVVQLKLRGCPNDFSAFSENAINFKTVKQLEIGFTAYGKTDLTMSNIKLSFERLEDITLDLDTYNWGNALTNFLERHQSITKVTLRSTNNNETGVMPARLNNVAGSKYLYVLPRHILVQPINAQANNAQAINEQTLDKIVQTLPLLTELHFFGAILSTDNLVYLLNRFNLLKYSFSLKNPQEFDNLKISLGNKWHSTIDHGDKNVTVKVERIN